MIVFFPEVRFVSWFGIRLGFLIDFLSHAAVVGFMGGAAITIALQQLKGFVGIKDFTKKADLISVMNSVFSSAHHGVSSLSLLTILSLSLHFNIRTKS